MNTSNRTLDLTLNFEDVPTEDAELFLTSGSKAMPEFAASCEQEEKSVSLLAADSCGTCITSCGTCNSCTT